MMKKREKYREDPLEDEDLLDDGEEDGGVLSDYEDEPDDETATGAR